MKKRFFVTATNTDIGKTYTTLLLLKEFASRGIKVGAIKLIETGVIEDAPDAKLLLERLKEYNKEFTNSKIEEIVPITYKLPAAPYVASQNAPLDLLLLKRAVENIESKCEVLIIEGAGGLYVPLDKEYMMIDMIDYFNAKAILVTHCALGCINDTLLSEKALENAKVKYVTLFNCRENEKNFTDVSQAYFEDTREKFLKVDKDIDTICDVLYNL